MISPHIILDGGNEYLPFAKSKARSILWTAQKMGGNGHYKCTFPGGETLQITVSLPSTYTIILRGSGIELKSGYVDNYGLSGVYGDPWNTRKLQYFYPSSLQSPLVPRAWKEEIDLVAPNYSYINYYSTTSTRISRTYLPPSGSFGRASQTGIANPNGVGLIDNMILDGLHQGQSTWSSLYTGKMEKAVALVMGQTRRQVEYEYGFYRTNGIFTASNDKLWLIEIGDRGILAKPLTGAARVKNMSMNTGIKAAGMPIIPDGKSFGYATDIEAEILSGNIIRLATDTDMLAFYTYESAYLGTGWAFNESGDEAQNIAFEAITSGPNRYLKSRRFKVTISENMTTKKPDSASVTEVDNGWVDTTMVRFPVDVRCGDVIQAPSFNQRPIGDTIDGPIFVYYSGNTEKLFKFTGSRTTAGTPAVSTSGPRPPASSVAPGDYFDFYNIESPMVTNHVGIVGPDGTYYTSGNDKGLGSFGRWQCFLNMALLPPANQWGPSLPTAITVGSVNNVNTYDLGSTDVSVSLIWSPSNRSACFVRENSFSSLSSIFGDTTVIVTANGEMSQHVNNHSAYATQTPIAYVSGDIFLDKYSSGWSAFLGSNYHTIQRKNGVLTSFWQFNPNDAEPIGFHFAGFLIPGYWVGYS